MNTYPPLPALTECVYLTDRGVGQLSLVNVSTQYTNNNDHPSLLCAVRYGT